MTQATEPESLAALIARALAWIREQPEDVRQAVRQRAIDRMLEDGNVSATGIDTQVLRRYMTAEAVLELRRSES